MIDHVTLFAEFETEQERQQQPREQVKKLINSHCRKTGKPHSLAWRTAYIMLESATGYRVPEDAKSRLQTVESAGFIDDLLKVVKSLE